MLLWLIWGAMLFSIVIYSVVLTMVTGNPDAIAPDPDIAVQLSYILAGLGFGLVAMTFIARQVMLHKPLADGKFDSLTKLRGAYLTVSIISWALAEAIALFGFVLSFLSHNLDYYMAFAPAGILMLLLTRPQARRIEEQFEVSQSSEKSPGATAEGEEIKPTDSW